MSIRDSKKQANSVKKLHDKVYLWINVISISIAAIFTFVEIRNAPLDKIADVFDEKSFITVGLVIIFFGLGFGAKSDAEIQLKMLAVDSKNAETGIREGIGVFLFVSALFGMFWFRGSPVIFQLFLLTLICVNCWTFAFVINERLTPAIQASRDFFTEQKDYAGYMKLYMGVEYLTGNWQKKRFFTLIILAVIQLILSIIVFKIGISIDDSRPIFNGLTFDRLMQYMPSIIFIAYVVISEVWMRVYRQRILSDFHAIDELADYFRISRRAGSQLPEINFENLFFRKSGSSSAYS